MVFHAKFILSDKFIHNDQLYSKIHFLAFREIVNRSFNDHADHFYLLFPVFAYFQQKFPRSDLRRISDLFYQLDQQRNEIRRRAGGFLEYRGET